MVGLSKRTGARSDIFNWILALDRADWLVSFLICKPTMLLKILDVSVATKDAKTGNLAVGINRARLNSPLHLLWIWRDRPLPLLHYRGPQSIDETIPNESYTNKGRTERGGAKPVPSFRVARQSARRHRIRRGSFGVLPLQPQRL